MEIVVVIEGLRNCTADDMKRLIPQLKKYGIHDLKEERPITSLYSDLGKNMVAVSISTLKQLQKLVKDVNLGADIDIDYYDYLGIRFYLKEDDLEKEREGAKDFANIDPNFLVKDGNS